MKLINGSVHISFARSELFLSREAAHQRCSLKKVFLKYVANLQENTLAIPQKTLQERTILSINLFNLLILKYINYIELSETSTSKKDSYRNTKKPGICLSL